MKQRDKSRQLSLIPDLQKKLPKYFGGSHLKGNAKYGRPLSEKAPIHLVLKAENGFGTRSMLHPKNVVAVNRCVRQNAEKNGIRIYHFVNVGNHLHLIVKINQRRRYLKFIRTISGLIVRHVLGKERGKELQVADARSKKTPTKKYWLNRPFTRIASWGRDYNGLCRYMIQNQNQVKYWGLRSGDKLGKLVFGFDSRPDQILNSA